MVVSFLLIFSNLRKKPNSKSHQIPGLGGFRLTFPCHGRRIHTAGHGHALGRRGVGGAALRLAFLGKAFPETLEITLW
jgi:hypothetical protein